MKNLYHLRYLLFALLFATVSGCGEDDEKQADPKPKTHKVLVEYFSLYMPTTAGAVVSSGSTLPDGTQPANLNSVEVSGNTTGSYEQEVTPDREFVVTIALKNIRPGDGGTKIPLDAELRAQTWVDGKVRNNMKVQSRANPGDPYPTLRFVIRTTDWE